MWLHRKQWQQSSWAPFFITVNLNFKEESGWFGHHMKDVNRGRIFENLENCHLDNCEQHKIIIVIIVSSIERAPTREGAAATVWVVATEKRQLLNFGSWRSPLFDRDADWDDAPICPLWFEKAFNITKPGLVDMTTQHDYQHLTDSQPWKFCLFFFPWSRLLGQREPRSFFPFISSFHLIALVGMELVFQWN